MHDSVLILAPRGRDAAIAAELLQRHDVDAHICPDEVQLVKLLDQGAGAVLITEEALAAAPLSGLVTWVAAQPTWSDIPFVVLANGSRTPRTISATDRLAELGNVVLLERPLHAEAMLGAVRSSLKARSRQYQVRDTTAQLRESEERLRLAVENAEVGFWDVDVVNDRLIWPGRTKAMFGISPEVPVTMADFYNGLHPDDREATSAAYAAAADPSLRALYDVEYRTIGKKDGVERWVAAKGRGSFDATGRCLRVAGTALDITARKAAEVRRVALIDLAEALTDLEEPADIAYAAARVLGGTLKVTRAGYAAIDHDAETLHVERDWTAPGVATLAGVLPLRRYGSFVDDLKRGEITVVVDAQADTRVAQIRVDGDGRIEGPAPLLGGVADARHRHRPADLSGSPLSELAVGAIDLARRLHGGQPFLDDREQVGLDHRKQRALLAIVAGERRRGSGETTCDQDEVKAPAHRIASPVPRTWRRQTQPIRA